MRGKIKTVLQMVAVPLLIFYKAVLQIPQIAQYEHYVYLVGMGFLYASLFMTVYSGIEYVTKNKEVFRQ